MRWSATFILGGTRITSVLGEDYNSFLGRTFPPFLQTGSTCARSSLVARTRWVASVAWRPSILETSGSQRRAGTPEAFERSRDARPRMMTCFISLPSHDMGCT
jgi:hypothetical protein